MTGIPTEIFILLLLAIALSLSIPQSLDLLRSKLMPESAIPLTSTIAIVVLVASVALSFADHGATTGMSIVLVAIAVSQIAALSKSPLLAVLSALSLVLYLQARSAAG
jgi:hypothetical protein